MAGIRRGNRKDLPQDKKIVPVRIAVLLLILSLITAIVVIRLVYLQVFDSSDRYADQIDQSVTQVYTTASRGDILDRNGNILAQDSSAKAIYVVPMNVRRSDLGKVAEVLSTKLNLNYDEVYQTVSMLEDDIVEVQKGVSSENAGQMMAAVPKGLTYDSGTLYCCPAEIEDVSKTSAVIQQVLGMSQEDAETYLTKRENSPQLIKHKVDNAIAAEIYDAVKYTDPEDEEVYSNGLTMLEDHKRYYTKDTFLASVLGFTNDDGDGVNGVEQTCNGTLSGEKGIVLYQKDAEGNDIPSQTKVIREASSGEDVTLTIDMNIQSQVEEILKDAVDQWSAKGGTAIVMSTETGEILAMASYPTYSLSDPYTISSEYAGHYAQTLAGLDTGEQQETMWKNPAVSLTYEPGSTFKAITSSAALEEGVVSPDTTVYCDGSIAVGNGIIKCTGNHGTQTVRQAIANSCNPGLVTIIEKLEPQIFYNYAYRFGYGHATGIELTGEEDGILTRVVRSDGTFDSFDYATLSFGQGLATTPIQNLSALNAVVNDGYYVKPTILSENNSEKLERNHSENKSKQIISAATSQEMRAIMSDVVSAETNANLAEQAEGYSIGGKTGTAEQYVNGSYSQYVTSFFCYGPVEDPKYSILVLLDGTPANVTGSSSAAPAAISMMKYVMDTYVQGTGGKNLNDILMPALVGQDVETAKTILQDKGIAYHITQQDTGTTVLSQSLEANAVYTDGTEVELVIGTSESDASGTVTVPDLTGLSVQTCNTLLNGLGLNMKISGSGFASGQDPPAGTRVEKGTMITVTFQ